MREISLTELITETFQESFFGGMTSEEHIDDEKLEDLHVYLARHQAEISLPPSLTT